MNECVAIWQRKKQQHMETDTTYLGVHTQTQRA